MLMDEPFGAIDPITRERLQNDFLRLHSEIARRSSSSRTTSTRRSRWATASAILRQGGKLAQFDTPEEILANPADDFVARLRRRRPRPQAPRLRSLGEIDARQHPGANGHARPEAGPDMTLRDALSLMLTEGSVRARGPRRRRRRARLPDPRGVSRMLGERGEAVR